MQTKRDYLVGLGLAKPGRGKFSNAAKEALAKAEREGVKFADVTPVKPRPETPTKESATGNPAPRTSPGDSLYLSPSDFRFPENEYVAVAGDGTKYSMRECCNTCKVSLTNHACSNPSVLGKAVVIRPVKA